MILCVLNFTPVPRTGYRVGVPGPGYWTEMLNTDAGRYGGSNVGNNGGVHAEFVPMHGQPYSLLLTLPPLGGGVLQGAGSKAGSRDPKVERDALDRPSIALTFAPHLARRDNDADRV